MTSMQNADDASSPSLTSIAELDSRLLRYAQLGLRLIGVMFVFEGVAGLCGSLVYMVMYALALARGGYDSSLPDAHSCGWFASSFVTTVFGYYLISDGRKIVELVFVSQHPAFEAGHVAGDDRSERPNGA
jgi:hypothetical protein